MSTIPGLQQIRTIEVPLVGKKSIMAQLLDSASTAFPITSTFVVKVEVLASPDAAAALFTLRSDAGTVVVLDTLGYIYCPLSDVNAALMKVGKLHTLRVTLLLVADETVIELLNTFYLIPLNQLLVWSRPTEVAMALSTVFKNTLYDDTGEAALDAILCVNQPVGCQVEIYVDENNPPQTWVLRASVVATAAGATRRCIDYAAGTNEKVWFRSS